MLARNHTGIGGAGFVFLASQRSALPIASQLLETIFLHL
jgi:hypothetical protein